MEATERKNHWENIYSTRPLNEVSWYQQVPETSLNLIAELGVAKDAKIIDMGGGDSLLADFLLQQGYTDITVADISEKALSRAQARLGSEAAKIRWIVADAATFKPEEQYDLWHDRATFHFLTGESEIRNYTHTISNHLKPGGALIVGTFSETGPTKCSGINIKQYTEASLTEALPLLQRTKCGSFDHSTPSGSVQNFVFCTFRKMIDSNIIAAA